MHKNRVKIIVLTSIFLVNINLCLSQINFIKNDSISVSVNGINLSNAWAGGLNFIQASSIDLNYDGIEDLFLFDRSGNKINTFINLGIQDSICYVSDNSYRNKFPQLSSWALLRDYNNDGKKDIFSYAPGGFLVYKNSGNAADGLSFELVSSKVYSNYFSDYIPLYVTSVDIPAIDDIDNDGDLDVLTYSVNGVYVEYHQNKSMELYGVPDSLSDFNLNTPCWGKFRENELNCEITLDLPCTGLRTAANILHSGSSLSTYDMDGDGDKEVVIGDISCTTNTLIVNGGDNQIANGISQTHNFPNSTNPINFNNFPTSYFLDVNNDQKKDVIASPNVFNAAENARSIWFYKNVGTEMLPNFKKINENFLQNQMLEVGEGAHPILEDLDGDGLKDLLIGNYGYYSVGGNNNSKLAFFKNIGILNEPIFQFQTNDYQNFSQLNMRGLYPAFGDLDGDGDKDLLLGNEDGKMVYCTNIPNNGVANFVLSESFYKGIDIGNFATPQIVDIDGDGKLDLLIGEERGTVNFCRNEGTTTAPDFSVANLNPLFGNINVSKYIPNSIAFGYSTPKFFKFNGQSRIISGSQQGYIYLYENIDNNLNGNFTLVDSTLSQIWEGERSVPEISDINNDGKPDLFLGNYAGGLSFFKFDNVSNMFNLKSTKNLSVYPNPSKDNIYIKTNMNRLNSVSVFDLNQRLILFESVFSGNNLNIDISKINAGYYILKVSSSEGDFYEKFIKN